jgi:hypothetical protein
MKKIFLIIITVLAMNFSFAQNDLGKLDDVGKISLTPVLPEVLADMPQGAKNMLFNKLMQIAVKNGLGGVAYEPNFIITATVDVESKDVTSSALIALKLNMNFYIIDYANETILAEFSRTAKGVGKTDEKAYIEAIKTIDPKASEFKKFVNTGKEKIVEYYNTKCDVILKNAETLSNTGKYEEAIVTLMSVPEVCMECYTQAMDAVVPIHKKMVSANCNQYLEAAKQAWLNQDLETARRNLVLIEAGSQCYDAGFELSKKINSELGSVSNENSNQNDGNKPIVMRKAEEPASKGDVISDAKKTVVNNSNGNTQEYNLEFVK